MSENDLHFTALTEFGLQQNTLTDALKQDIQDVNSKLHQMQKEHRGSRPAGKHMLSKN